MNNLFPSPGEIKLCYGHDVAPSCPRCESSNTKFCYYNNYSLSQPRYYCKSCRRYWTKGGSLRNIPASGSCKKRSKRKRQRSRRFGRNKNQLDHRHDDNKGSPCKEIDLAAVFENYLNGQSPNNSSSDNTTTRSIQGTKKSEGEEGIGKFLEDDMFEFQSFLNDKEIQEILRNCSFSY